MLWYGITALYGGINLLVHTQTTIRVYDLIIICRMYRVLLLWLSCAPQPSRYVPADAGFVSDKAAVLGAATKKDHAQKASHFEDMNRSMNTELH